jgi:hypothetical protein
MILSIYRTAHVPTGRHGDMAPCESSAAREIVFSPAMGALNENSIVTVRVFPSARTDEAVPFTVQRLFSATTAVPSFTGLSHAVLASFIK